MPNKFKEIVETIYANGFYHLIGSGLLFAKEQESEPISGHIRRYRTVFLGREEYGVGHNPWLEAASG